MQYRIDDTIGALASAPGPAGRGIVRLSGPDAISLAGAIFRPQDSEHWGSARAAFAHAGSLSISGVACPIPVLLYRWPGGRSYTGQPLVEIHAPGSPPLLEGVLAEFYERGVRPAAPGEFTARAFLSGRLDLVQAEAVLEVIEAHDSDRLTRALRQLAGGISGRIAAVRSDLVDLLADLEAGLDFVEEDIEFVSPEQVACRIERAAATLADLLQQCRGRMESSPRRRVVLAGLPNAGKSTLFNALLDRDAALVSPVPGTTRDYLVAHADWQGLPVALIDTPGWQETIGDVENDPLMRQARDLVRDQCETADLVLWCSSTAADEAEQALDAERLKDQRSLARSLLRVWTKADLAAQASGPAGPVVSGRFARGLGELVACSAQILSQSAAEGEILGTTAARCQESLYHAHQSLLDAIEAARGSGAPELIALELRETLEHLGRILGTVYTDDILDRVFSRFCIGK